MNPIAFIIPTNGTEKVLTIDIDNWSEESLFNFVKEHCTELFWDCEINESFHCQIMEYSDGKFELTLSGDNGCRTFESVEAFCL